MSVSERGSMSMTLRSGRQADKLSQSVSADSVTPTPASQGRHASEVGHADDDSDSFEDFLAEVKEECGSDLSCDEQVADVKQECISDLDGDGQGNFYQQHHLHRCAVVIGEIVGDIVPRSSAAGDRSFDTGLFTVQLDKQTKRLDDDEQETAVAWQTMLSSDVNGQEGSDGVAATQPLSDTTELSSDTETLSDTSEPLSRYIVQSGTTRSLDDQRCLSAVGTLPCDDSEVCLLYTSPSPRD